MAFYLVFHGNSGISTQMNVDYHFPMFPKVFQQHLRTDSQGTDYGAKSCAMGKCLHADRLCLNPT